MGFGPWGITLGNFRNLTSKTVYVVLYFSQLGYLGAFGDASLAAQPYFCEKSIQAQSMDVWYEA